MNDKHSSAPAMFKCQFRPCPYESKRESNCKQHMEKAHDWTYVRSKNNGKNGKRAPTGKTPPTPQTGSPASNAFNAPTPDFSDAPSHYDTSPEQQRSLRSPTFASPLLDVFANEAAPFHELFGPSSSGVQWPDAAVDYSPVMINNAGPSRALNLPWDQAGSGQPVEARDEESFFGSNLDWSNASDPTLTSMHNLQLATPATSVGSHPLHNSAYTYPNQPAQQRASLSPHGQGSLMFNSPYSVHESEPASDEGFADFANGPITRPAADFSLYGTSNAAGPAEPSSLFGELPPLEPPTEWSGRGADLAQHLGIQSDAMEE